MDIPALLPETVSLILCSWPLQLVANVPERGPARDRVPGSRDPAGEVGSNQLQHVLTAAVLAEQDSHKVGERNHKQGQPLQRHLDDGRA